jgi:acyl transferase domain-containing protein/NAD(P)H-dependent flavin oxidoreductase YrpB (nitropropane dioxygenase family)/NAD(P)-dependent dehydrogenase (short-subunit alcohol dehydrogenase family)/phosphopantetheinyl transferase (holo-ACP synthase)
MRKQLPFELNTPVLFVNPGLNRDSRLIECVSEAGGLGVVDRFQRADVCPPSGLRYGVRVSIEDAKTLDPHSGIVCCVIPFEEAPRLVAVCAGDLAALPVPALVEVGCAADAAAAEAAGASGLIARGNEGPGRVSELNGFVLLQEVLERTDLPVFLRGGISPFTASGAIAAGATGVVLDAHLLLCDESAISPALKSFLGALSTPATVTLGDGIGAPVRVYARVGTKTVRNLRKVEDGLSGEEADAFIARVADLCTRVCDASPDTEDALLPLSEDILTARALVASHTGAKGVVGLFKEAMSGPAGPYAFHEGSGCARAQGTRFPIVQGPMAHVSDSPDFLGLVAKGGALPFLALGNMPPAIAAEALKAARTATDGRFGVGLIGLEVNRRVYEAHLELMKENPPPFAILAAGSPELAAAIESMGTKCHLHCPSPGVLAEALARGLRRFVFEGAESGGHIGLMGSLELWNANLHVLEEASRQGLHLGEVFVFFAGGIATPRAAAFISGMVRRLVAQGLNVGLQIGTAYLCAEEAVTSGAITPLYRDLTLRADRTAVIGRTVNTRARCADSPMARKLLELEWERARKGVPLKERKELYEKDNLGALRLASKGCAIDASTATAECPVFSIVPEPEQLERGLYLMGQAATLINSPTTIKDLHDALVRGGEAVFKSSFSSTSSTPSDSSSREEPCETTVDDEPAGEPIAVVGIGLRLPGASSPDSFWDMIVKGRSGIVEAPPGRWDNLDFYYDKDPSAPDKTYSKIGGFITDFVFDPLKYRIPPAVARKMDRTQQMAVVCAADAVADAGIPMELLREKRVGVILGNSMGGETTDLYAARVGAPRAMACLEKTAKALGLSADAREAFLKDFRERYLEDLPEITEDSLPGELANVISGRVANVFNLTGPNFTVDAACASSMAAVMNATAALRDGSIDVAITGGVDAAMHPSSFVKFCKIGALSPDGSRPFDEGANGFVMGEGAGVLVLKRLSDAVRDGDRIYGTIKAIGSSSDGRGKGITAPNAAGQERAVRAALRSAGISQTSIGLIEAHGTSTAVGDRTELLVLDKLLKEAGAAPKSTALGSVKSQIGHLKAASGAAGLIKTLLALHNATLPPTINVKKPNPCIDWERSPVFLAQEPRPWLRPDDAPRRAGVSAFGFGGTNFHVILEEYVPEAVMRVQPARNTRRARRARQGARPSLVPLKNIPNWPAPLSMKLDAQPALIAGKDDADLAAKIDELLRTATSSNWKDKIARLREGASEAPVRCGFAASDEAEFRKKLTSVKAGLLDPRKRAAFPALGVYAARASEAKGALGAAFLFPGQGSQYPFMLRDLAARFPLVAETLAEGDEILEAMGRPPVTRAMFPPEDADAGASGDGMKDTQLLQPMILTANAALDRLLKRFGVTPCACAGHSLGEYAACVSAGIFSFRDGLEAVAVRGAEMAKVSIADPGLMMSVPADARVVEEALAKVDGYVVAANKNSPRQTVISGETEAVKAAGELFKAMGLQGTLLPVSAAFHSGVVAPAREPFMRTLNRLKVNQPTAPVLSNVTGDFYPVGPAAAEKIRDLLGKQFAAPVEWVKSLRRLYNDGVRIFLEVGPKRILTNLTLETLSEDVLALPTNHPRKGGVVQFMEALTALAVHGVPVDWTALEGDRPSPELFDERPPLRLVTKHAAVEIQPPVQTVYEASPLSPLLDDDLKRMSQESEFAGFIELQAEPIRALIKTGFQTYLKTVAPMERTIRVVKSEGIDFSPVVVSGASAGLPSEVRFPFDKENLDELIQGKNFIKRVPDHEREMMVEKRIERLVKGPDGEADLRLVDDVSGVIKLAGFFEDAEFIDEYGVDARVINALDITGRLALAAGIEALKDAGIPLVQGTKTTTAGGSLPDSFALPEPLRDETGVIFASAFPGLASLAQEVTRETASRFQSGAKKRLMDFYMGLMSRVRDMREKEEITRWFTGEFSRLDPGGEEELYTFNRNFLMRVLSLASGQMAQFIKAKGPNTHVDAACASTTQAILLARDWIRTGQARRVLVVAADDVAGRTLLPWVGSGFLAMGAATVNGDVGEAAVPFDDRRAGLILGSAAAGFVLEREDACRERGMAPLASIEAGLVANSAFHGTRLDVDHIANLMDRMVSKWEEHSGRSRKELARDMFFMSHETYSPKRGGSAAAEVEALRRTFGDDARRIPIANTKGFTGHTMGVGIEDATAIRCLQKGLLPPIANLKRPDPDFADLNLSKGGPCEAHYSLRLAAGFGSQIVMALYKLAHRGENRLIDHSANLEWLKSVSGYANPVLSVERRTLQVTNRVTEATAPEPRAAVIESAPPTTSTPVDEGTRGGQAIDETQVKERVLALLSEKTGYPADMLDPDLDLEADLGIDTVKQAEFISEVRTVFNIPRVEGLKIADFPTIKHIVRFVMEKAGAISGRDGLDATIQRAAEPDAASAGRDESSSDDLVTLYETTLKYLPRDKIRQESPQAEKILVVGGPERVGVAVEAALGAAGYGNVRRVDEIPGPEDFTGASVGAVYVRPLNPSDTLAEETFTFLRNLAIACETGPSFLVVVSSEDGAFGFENPSPFADSLGAVCGAVKSFAREFENSRVRLLDLAPGWDAERVADLVIESLSHDIPTETAVSNDGAFRVVGLTPLVGKSDPLPLGSDDVVLVTGGARGITAECVKALAVDRSLTIVILGRSRLSDRSAELAGFSPDDWREEKRRIIERLNRRGGAVKPVMVERELAALRSEAEVLSNLRELRRLGAEVMYRSVDVTDSEAVDEAVAEVASICRRVDVVIHGAGLDVSRALKSKSPQEMSLVYRVKVDGLKHTLEALEHHGLPFSRLVAFGSVSGRFGNRGQVDYAAANDALAHLLRRIAGETDAPVRLIDWAPWAEIGMAARETVQKALEEAGVGFITPKKGSSLLMKVVETRDASVELVAAGAWGPFEKDAFLTEKINAGGDLRLVGQDAELIERSDEFTRASVFLDPTKPLLDHHRIDRAAVLPGVGGMALMRAAASLYDQSVQKATIRNLRFPSPLKVFKRDPFEAAIRVEKTTDARGAKVLRAAITSQVRDKQGNSVGEPRLHHECEFLISAEEAENAHRQSVPEVSADNEAPDALDLPSWTHTLFVAGPDVYKVFFHGPAFQVLEHVTIETSGQGVTFGLADPAAQCPVFDDPLPLALEGAFQAAAALAVEAFGVMALPLGLKTLMVRDETPRFSSGALIRRGERVTEGSDPRRIFVFDGLLKDSSGRTVATIEGIEMIELEKGPRFPNTLFEVSTSVGAVMSNLEEKGREFLESCLTPEETAEYNSKTVPKRAAEWLAGRIAAKEAVKGALGRFGAPPDSLCVRVMYDEHGKPVLASPETAEPGLMLSICHSNGSAMAVAGTPGDVTGVGVDAEKVLPRAKEWIEDHFRVEEIDAATNGSGPDPLPLTRMWCAKEAVLKALGVGLRVDLREIDASAVAKGAAGDLKFYGEAAKLIRERGGAVARAHADERDGLVVARAEIRRK